MPKDDPKVLLVDDEPRVLSGLRRRLSDRFQILTAENAAEAICVLEGGHAIGAILTDMRMPDRDGVDLLGEVAQRWPDIRRLMLTGNNDQETAIAAVNHGRVFRFFRKPCDADQLAASLNEALDEYRFVTGARAEHCALELRAQAGARSREVFLSTMSHELLTPLNHILGFSSVLEMKLQDSEENEIVEYLTHIKDSGVCLLRLVQRVLEIVRLTSGDPGRERKVIEITRLIEEELERVREEASARDISISFQTPPAHVFSLTNDYELRFALRELLDNAIKFNAPGGHVAVAINRDRRNELTIRVADTGVGMTEEAMRDALGIFSQGEQGYNRRFNGMGLGLAFVSLYANANEGRVTIESEKDSGTAIMLSIPCAERAELVSMSA